MREVKEVLGTETISTGWGEGDKTLERPHTLYLLKEGLSLSLVDLRGVLPLLEAARRVCD